MSATPYCFAARVWKHKFDGATAWHFITLSEDVSAEIRFLSSEKKSPWGSLRVIARIGATEWKTSLFPDAKSGCYLLPVKADVRKRENLKDGTTTMCQVSCAI